jgi:hypothetical protein
MADSLTADEDEWPDCTRYVFFPVVRLPPLEPGDLDRMGATRDCMRGGIPPSVRLGRQLFPRRQARNCCIYHSVNWHRVSAVAIDVARQVPDAPRLWDENCSPSDPDGEIWEQTWSRIGELLTASALTDAERRFAESLLWPGDGIIVGHMAGHRDLSYTGGMHRAHALLAAGVRRTVIIRSRCCRPDRDCMDGKISRTTQDLGLSPCPERPHDGSSRTGRRTLLSYLGSNFVRTSALRGHEGRTGPDGNTVAT